MFEQELKLTAVDQPTLQSIVKSTDITRHLCQTPTAPRRFLARYHDTKERHFQALECSLRSRMEGDVFRAAFKEKGVILDGLSIRKEYECDIDGWLGEINDLPGGDLKDCVTAIAGHDGILETLVIVDMQRTIYDLDIDGTKIECVSDVGVIEGNGKKLDLCELELELKSGAIDKISELGAVLNAKYDVRPSQLTKHQIGLALWDSKLVSMT